MVKNVGVEIHTARLVRQPKVIATWLVLVIALKLAELELETQSSLHSLQQVILAINLGYDYTV